ncbi:MAG: hypothetical protein M1819_006317 [Sarea resinae]|nr:MAG: hypothetical protein M1819_006317 [Sarea resinae]
MSSAAVTSDSSIATAPDQNAESTPLLRKSSVALTREPQKAPGRIRVFIVTCLLISAIDFGGYLAYAPQTEIFQDIICRRYYSRTNRVPFGNVIIDESECKLDAIQGELALVNGWLDTFITLPSQSKLLPEYPRVRPIDDRGRSTGILLAIPYGVLADRIGRKPVLILAIVGYIVTGVLIRVISTPISAALMTKNTWIPYLLASVITILGTLLAFGLPETLELAVKSSRASLLELADDENEAEDNVPVKGDIKSRVREGLREFAASTHFIWTNPSVMLVLFTFLVAVFEKQSILLLLQYVSKRFGWSIARASILISVQGVVKLALLLIILPLLSILLVDRLGMRSAKKDLRLSQGSAFLLMVGSLIIGIAAAIPSLVSGLVFLALGSALTPIARSLATSLVLPVHVGTLYAATGLARSVGTLIAGPILANTFRWGMSLGHAWLGLPYIAAAILYLFAFVAVSCVRLSRDSSSERQAEEHNDSGEDVRVSECPEPTGP